MRKRHHYKLDIDGVLDYLFCPTRVYSLDGQSKSLDRDSKEAQCARMTI